MNPLKQKTKDNMLVVGLAVIIILLVIIVTSGLLMVCWDYVMPDVFGLPELTYGQAIVMNMLSTLLFKTFSYSKGTDG